MVLFTEDPLFSEGWAKPSTFELLGFFFLAWNSVVSQMAITIYWQGLFKPLLFERTCPHGGVWIAAAFCLPHTAIGLVMPLFIGPLAMLIGYLPYYARLFKYLPCCCKRPPQDQAAEPPEAGEEGGEAEAAHGPDAPSYKEPGEDGDVEMGTTGGGTNNEMPMPQNDELSYKLKQLNDARQRGLLTEEEWRDARERVIEAFMVAPSPAADEGGIDPDIPQAEGPLLEAPPAYQALDIVTIQ